MMMKRMLLVLAVLSTTSSFAAAQGDMVDTSPPEPDTLDYPTDLEYPSEAVTREFVMYTLVGPTFCKGWDNVPAGRNRAYNSQQGDGQEVNSNNGYPKYEDVADAIFEFAWDAFLRYDVGSENRYLRARAVEEEIEEEDPEDKRKLISVCPECRDASNWKRCVKNRCLDRRRNRRLVKVPYLDGLARDAARSGSDGAALRRLQVQEREYVRLAVQHDPAVKEKAALYPCPVEFELNYHSD